MFVALVVLLLSLPAPSAGDRLFCADANGKYSPNSTYRASLRSLADELTAGAMKSHSATGTAGTGSDKVYSAVLCRGDSTGADCSRRLREAFGRTIGAKAAACALHKDVALYSELYQLRFSDEDFLSTFRNAPEWVDGTNLNLVPATDAGQFDELVAKLTRSLAEAAAAQPDRYATADALWSSPESQRTVYGLAQCTRDMPPERCRACLDGIAAEIRRRVGSSRMGGAIHGARCTLRYETGTQFFTETATGQRKGHALLIIATVYSLSVVCTRLLFCVLYIIKREKRGKIYSTEQPKNIDEILRLWKMEDTGSEFSLYDFSQIADATDNFSPGKILGQGGFGPVYKGIFPDGQEVAIKKLAARSSQGLVEFKNEIQLVAKLQHRHLVRLLGCCIHDEEKILIYEYMSNKSLDYFIFGKTNFFRWNNAVLVGVGGFLLVISISCLVFHIWVKTQRRREQTIFKLGRLYLSIQIAINLWRMGGANPEFSLYDFSQIKEATSNFSIGNKLGQGGFGPVYKGRLRNGHKIAVKRLETCSLQGLLEFRNEIQLIAKVQHKNLVKLLGCCTQGDREKIIVYEYMENKSLDYFIFDITKGRELNWSKRLRIVDGTAQGLLYLHNYSRICIVHRDLKASNILLDSAMNPKISDFGVARIFYSNMAESNTTRIVGTHGYIPPEYAFEGVCSIKTDVFSFGVLILEIISGKRTAHFYQYNGKLYNLIAYAWQLWMDGKWREMTYCPPGNENEEIERCVHVALLCVQESAEDRPAMERVVTMLNTKNMSLPPPKQPAYFHVNPSEQEVSSCNITISITLER